MKKVDTIRRSPVTGSRSPLAAAILLVVLISVGSAAFSASTSLAMAAAPAEDPRFEKLKSLAGTWVGLAGFGEPTDSTAVTYRLTGGGKVVMETLFAGTPHEMVTMYHCDGAGLLLTHYCAAGNQPRMKAVTGEDPSVIHFEFAGATNLASPDDIHMHNAVIRFLDADHVQSAWTSFQGGKPVGEAKFDLHRQKPR